MTIPCNFCGGLGRMVGVFQSLCQICEGHGDLEIAGSPTLVKCKYCDGLGRRVGTFGPPCPLCKGFGHLTDARRPPAPRKSSPPGEPLAPTGFTLIGDRWLAELRSCTPSQLDYRKLVRICEELNTSYSQGCYLAVIVLTRSLLDHVPPIFGKTTFAEVANNYGSKSFKDAMPHLDGIARKVADGHLHASMRKTETLPTRQQVDFGPSLDLLLA